MSKNNLKPTSKELFVNGAIMAPMSDVNQPAFCRVLKDLGCKIIYTGLLTSHGLVHGNKNTFEIIKLLPDGVTMVGQIFGAEPEIMRDAALILEQSCKFSAIDINMGCPVPKVVKGNAGVGLMRDPELAGRIVKLVSEAVKLPVTVKMRSGWSSEEINCLELAAICVDSGAAAVSLHPRTKVQAYHGKADWELVARMKEKISVPVIGSGDICSPQEAISKMKKYGCDSVMIGRATRTDPTILGRTSVLMQEGVEVKPPRREELLDIAIKHFRYHIDIEGPDRGVRSLRSHLAYYIKGMPGAADIRNRIVHESNSEMMIDMLEAYADFVKNNEK